MAVAGAKASLAAPTSRSPRPPVNRIGRVALSHDTSETSIHSSSFQNLDGFFQAPVTAFLQIPLRKYGTGYIRRNAWAVKRLPVFGEEDLVGQTKAKAVRQLSPQHVGENALR